MILRVADNFRGELSLPTVGYPIIAGNKISLRENQIHSEDVQTSIQKGWLVVEGAATVGKPSESGKYKVVNVNTSALSVSGILFNVGEVKFITQDQLENSDIQNAINLGYLKLEEFVVMSTEQEKASAKAKVKKTKSAKKVTKKVAKKAGKKKVSKKKIEEPEEEEAFRPEEPRTTVTTWEPHGQKAVAQESIKKQASKNAHKLELPRETKRKPSDPDIEVQSGDDIDLDESRKEVEELKRQIATKMRRKSKRKTKTTKKAKTTKTTKVKKKKKGRGKSIEPVGTRRPPPTADDFDMGIDIGNLPNESGGLGLSDVEISSSMRRAGNNEDVSLG